MAFRYATTVEETQWLVRQRQYRNAYLYSGEVPQGSWKVRHRSAPRAYRQETVTEGIMESVLDTIISSIGADPVRVTFQTDGADWSTRRRAIWQERYTEAQFDRTNMQDLDALMLRDALWGLVGTVYWDHDGESPRVTRLNPLSQVVDERACMYGPPTQRSWVEFMDRDQAKVEIPNPKDKYALERATSNYVWFVTPGPTMIARIRSWKLPSKKQDGTVIPGMYLDYTDAGIIDQKEWPYPFFPMTDFKWKEPLTGFYGRGPADMLAWLQGWRNKRLRQILVAGDLAIYPKWLNPSVNQNLVITNKPGEIVNHAPGQPPTLVASPTVAPEVYQDLDRNWNHMFAIPGVTQYSATGRKPSGLDSAPGQREYHANEEGRHLWQTSRFERVRVANARQLMRVSKELHKKGSDPTVMWKSKNLARKIPWSEVDPVEDQYIISLEPASILSRTPAGRVQQVVELAQAGLLDRASSLRLVGHPDFSRIVKLYDAPFDDIEATIEDLCAMGDRKPPPFPTPERYQDLGLGLTLIQLAYLMVKRDGAPDVPVLEGFRRWIRLAEFITAKGQPAPMAAPGPAPQQLPGVPAPPPPTLAAGGAPPQLGMVG